MKFYPKILTAARTGMGARLGETYVEACDALTVSVAEVSQGRGGDARVKQDFNQLLQSIAASMVKPQSAGGGYVVLDQFIGPTYAEAAIRFAPGIKFIFVDRDWRDQYAEVRGLLRSMMTANARLGVRPMGEDLGDYQLPEMEFFVNLRRRIQRCRDLHAASYANNVLWVDFEEVVEDTNRTAERIFGFLDLDMAGWRPNTCLHPEFSRKNIGKWRRSEYSAEIERLARVFPLPE